MGTRINELMKDISSNSLNQDENSRVDSIIHDINGSGTKTSQQQMPQLSDEEKQMLMQQHKQQEEQQMYEQQMQHQQMQQQQMQQQQMQQQMQQQQMQQQMHHHQPPVEEGKPKSTETIDILSEVLLRSKESIIVFVLTLFFNLNAIQDLTTIKTNSFFFNAQEGTPTIAMVLLKALVITSVFFAIQSVIMK